MRFKRFTIVIVLIMLVFLSACTPIESSEDSIRATMEILTSDEFQGRMTGTEGNEKTTLFIEEQFKEIGLEAYYEDNYFHSFDFINYIPEEERNDLIVEYENGSKESLKLGTDYVNMTLGVDKGEMTLPLTRDINDKNISQKIVLLEDSNDLSSVISKAKGMLMNLNDFRKGLSSPSNFYGFAVKPEVYNRLIDNKAINIIYTSNYSRVKESAYNVIGIIKGNTSDNALVLSAHFDHVGAVGDTIFRGAIDNASGTSVLLDLAKRLHKHSKKNLLGMDIIFCAFNGEELGLLGSNKFADEIKNEYKSIYNINIDCVGSKSGGPIYLDDEDYTSKELIEAIKPYLADKSLDYKDGYYGLSDNNSFVVRDIPGITIGQGDLDYIHTELDTLEDVDYKYLVLVSDAIYNFIVENNGIEFNPVINVNSKIKKGSPSDEEWANAIKKFKEVISIEKNIQYDEEVEYLSNGYLFKGDGNRKLTDIDEINKYYPNITSIDDLLGYKFSSIDFMHGSTGFMVIYVSDADFSGDIGPIKKRNLSPGFLANVEIEYTNDIGEFLLVRITNTNRFRSPLMDYVEEIPLEGELNNYSLLRREDTNRLMGIYKEMGNLSIQIIAYKSSTLNDSLQVREYNKSQDELIQMIEEIEKGNIIEELLEKLGI